MFVIHHVLVASIILATFLTYEKAEEAAVEAMQEAIEQSAELEPSETNVEAENQALEEASEEMAAAVESGEYIIADQQVGGFSVGERIAAFTGCTWSPAVIVEIEGLQFNIEYAGGFIDIVNVEELRKLTDSPDIEVGDSVYALWDNVAFFPATVVEIQDDGVIIEWTNRSGATFVEFEEIFPEE